MSCGYDALDRLREWQINSVVTESYSYNATTGNLDTKGSPSLKLTYGDAEHAHAATGYNGWSYAYDDNGNMVTRVISPTTYTLVYDAENRLVKVHGATENQEQLRFGNPSQPIAEYSYNGDGQMVKADQRTIWQWKKAG